MNNLDNMKLWQRFVVLVVCVVLGFVVYGLWSFKTLAELKVNGPIYHNIIQGKDLVADVLPPPEYIIESYLVSLQLAASGQNESAQLVDRLKVLKTDYDTRHTYWEKEGLSSDLSDALLKQAHTPAEAFYAVAFSEFLPALQRGDSEAKNNAMTKMRTHYESHRKAIDKVVQLANQRVGDDEATAKRHIASGMTLMLVVLTFAIVLTVLLTILISRSVTRPLLLMQARMIEIKNSHDFTHRIGLGSTDEVGETAAAFDELINSLHATLSRLQQNAVEVSISAQSLAVSSRQVALSSGEQSSAASAMAATVEQLTTSIAHVADRAKDARDISADSGGRSSQGGKIISDAATAMIALAQAVKQASNSIGALGEKSGQISSVIKVIREVAEQTNLLALNAAIEAARAGEQGRGFAVVADEVRKLAERTSNATEEIARVIETMQSGTNEAISVMNSAVASADGAAVLAHEAGDAIDQIKGGVSSVEEAVTEISSSLEEQSRASNDIASHVEKVAQMVEENNAAAAQTADSAIRLEQLSTDMRSAVSSFRL
jgi:methyl-accepting chemotaxis protein